MRKRLRKKKHLGEFQELGFELSFDYVVSDVEEEDALLDAFLLEAVEARGLQFGGGGGRGTWSGFATAGAKGATATEAHREAVRMWLERRPEVTVVRVGPLRDAHHGW